MKPLRLAALAVALSILAHSATREDEKKAVETVVNSYEQACAALDFEKANTLLAPGARWIDSAPPEPAGFNGKGSSKHWDEYKAAKLRMESQVRDLVIEIHGDTAWATVTNAITSYADNPAALALNSNQRVWHGNFVESMVLVKVGGVWKIVLGQSSEITK